MLHIELIRHAHDRAPTLLERLFWAWLSGGGDPAFAEYQAEALITDLRGPGYVPCDERGEP